MLGTNVLIGSYYFPKEIFITYKTETVTFAMFIFVIINYCILNARKKSLSC